MKKIIATGLMLLFLNGCFGGRSQMSAFFLLQPIRGEQVVSAKNTTIAVESVRVPDFLDKPQIVLQNAQNGQVLFSETKRWAEPLSAVLQRTIIDDLTVYLPNAYIKTKQYTDETYAYTIVIEVNQMTGSLGGEAVLDVWWSLKNASGKMISRDKAQFNRSVGNTYEDYVLAQSEMVSQLSRQIANKIAEK